jgi:hypothetical protein
MIEAAGVICDIRRPNGTDVDLLYVDFLNFSFILWAFVFCGQCSDANRTDSAVQFVCRRATIRESVANGSLVCSYVTLCSRSDRFFLSNAGTEFIGCLSTN